MQPPRPIHQRRRLPAIELHRGDLQRLAGLDGNGGAHLHGCFTLGLSAYGAQRALLCQTLRAARKPQENKNRAKVLRRGLTAGSQVAFVSTHALAGTKRLLIRFSSLCPGARHGLAGVDVSESAQVVADIRSDSDSTDDPTCEPTRRCPSRRPIRSASFTASKHPSRLGRLIGAA